jgi:hypothetical protein
MPIYFTDKDLDEIYNEEDEKNIENIKKREQEEKIKKIRKIRRILNSDFSSVKISRSLDYEYNINNISFSCRSLFHLDVDGVVETCRIVSEYYCGLSKQYNIDLQKWIKKHSTLKDTKDMNDFILVMADKIIMINQINNEH